MPQNLGQPEDLNLSFEGENFEDLARGLAAAVGYFTYLGVYVAYGLEPPSNLKGFLRQGEEDR